jgi:hypothetical protein
LLAVKKIKRVVLSQETGIKTVTIPWGAEIIAINSVQEKLIVSVFYDPAETRTDTTEFQVYGIEEEIAIDTAKYRYLGTVKFRLGVKLAHVFVKYNSTNSGKPGGTPSVTGGTNTNAGVLGLGGVLGLL